MTATGSGFRSKTAAWMLVAGLLIAAWTADGAPVIRSGAEPDYPPLCFIDEDGSASGFSVKLLREALATMGCEVSFETASWVKLKQKLADGRLDVLPLVGRTPEREALYDFTVPYLTLHGALFVREDESAIQSLADLPGKTIAVMKGDNAEEYVLRANLSERVVSTATFEEAFRMLSAGEADAVIAQKLMGVTLLKSLGIPNVRVTGQPNEEFKQNFCFAVQKGNQPLLSILNEGLALTIQDGTQQRLKQKWLGTPFYEAALARPLVYSGDRAFPPYEYLDKKGRPAGFNIDLARALARELDVAISFRLEPWSDVRRKMDEGAIDLAAMFYSEGRDRTADFSAPLTASAQAVFAGKDSPLYTGLDSLRGKRISVQNGDLAHDYLLENGFSDELIVTQIPQEALRMLADGEVDFSAGALLQGRYWIDKNKWNHLHAADKHLFVTDYCFAVPHGNTALLGRINEGLTLLKESGEYRDIYNEWLGVLDTGVRWKKLRRMLLTAGGALVLAAAVTLWFFNLLRRQVRKKTTELRRSEERFALATEAGGIGVWDRDIIKNRLVWDDRMFELYGVRKRDFGAAYEAWQHCIHPSDVNRVTGEVAAAERGEKEFDTEFRIIRPDGAVRHIRAFGKVIRDKHGTPVRMIGANQDITLRKKAEEDLRQRNAELERFNKAAVGRELRMIELKQEINALCNELGREKPYSAQADS
jgi:PAS domain S-box-containing protein